MIFDWEQHNRNTTKNFASKTINTGLTKGTRSKENNRNSTLFGISFQLSSSVMKH